MMACGEGHNEVVKLLLDCGARRDVKNPTRADSTRYCRRTQTFRHRQAAKECIRELVRLNQRISRRQRRQDGRGACCRRLGRKLVDLAGRPPPALWRDQKDERRPSRSVARSKDTRNRPGISAELHQCIRHSARGDCLRCSGSACSRSSTPMQRDRSGSRPL
jgi:hypothetical protein